MAAVKSIEERGAADLADRVLKRVKAVYRWAVTHERIASNPMVDLVLGEIFKPRHVTHRAALADADLPEFLAKLAAYDGDPHTVHALRLLMLTATRPGETRGALWAEFELDAALWTIPVERMKMHLEHRVPLSRQTDAVVGRLPRWPQDRQGPENEEAGRLTHHQATRQPPRADPPGGFLRLLQFFQADSR